MGNRPISENGPFGVMAGMLREAVRMIEEAAAYSEQNLYRPEMSFSELREHLTQLAALYERQLAHKAFLTHRGFSVKKAAKRKNKPMTAERRRQLIAAGKKGGSKIGSQKKAAAAKENARLRWKKAIRLPGRKNIRLQNIKRGGAEAVAQGVIPSVTDKQPS